MNEIAPLMVGFLVVLAAAVLGWYYWRSIQPADDEDEERTPILAAMPSVTGEHPKIQAAEHPLSDAQRAAQLARQTQVLTEPLNPPRPTPAQPAAVQPATDPPPMTNPERDRIREEIRSLHGRLQQAQWMIQQQSEELDLRPPPDDILRMLRESPLSGIDIAHRLEIEPDELKARTGYLISTGQIVAEGSTDPGNSIYRWAGVQTTPHRPRIEAR